MGNDQNILVTFFPPVFSFPMQTYKDLHIFPTLAPTILLEDFFHLLFYKHFLKLLDILLT